MDTVFVGPREGPDIPIADLLMGVKKGTVKIDRQQADGTLGGCHGLTTAARSDPTGPGLV